jgi:hypothetical protein
VVFYFIGGKMFKIFFMLLILFFTFFTLVVADTLIGQVLAEEDEKPVPSVFIKLKDLNLLTYTNNEGKFIFRDIQLGEYLITIERIGYQKIRKFN